MMKPGLLVLLFFSVKCNSLLDEVAGNIKQIMAGFEGNRQIYLLQDGLSNSFY